MMYFTPTFPHPRVRLQSQAKHLAHFLCSVLKGRQKSHSDSVGIKALPCSLHL